MKTIYIERDDQYDDDYLRATEHKSIGDIRVWPLRHQFAASCLFDRFLYAKGLSLVHEDGFLMVGYVGEEGDIVVQESMIGEAVDTSINPDHYLCRFLLNSVRFEPRNLDTL